MPHVIIIAGPMIQYDIQKQEEDRIQKILDNPEVILQAFEEGVRSALLKHKQAGNSVCGWHDGKVVWIPPEEI